MTLKVKVIDREERPRCEFGIDYDATRIVLARFEAKELQWHRAGKHWASLGHYASHPASLVFHDYHHRGGETPWTRHESWTIHEGGRLSKVLLKDYAKKINEFFTVPVAKHLHPRKTIIVTEE